jgi:hypothetical protein
MTEPGMHYWDLDIPGLDGEEARHLASVIKDHSDVQQVILSDPSLFLTLRLDKRTVEALVQAVTVALREVMDDEDKGVLSGLREDFDEWLATAGD